MLRTRKTMVIIDESTCIKNPKAKRSKYIVDTLRPLSRCRRILSGLPTPRSPLDIFQQFYFLNPDILGQRNYWVFRRRYAVMRKVDFGGRMVDIVVGYRNLEEIKRRIEPYSYRVEFRPKIPSTYVIADIKLSDEQIDAYQKMKQFATMEIAKEAHVTATIVITQLLKLHQILCGHVIDEHGKVHYLPERRTAKVLELLEHGGGKTVIWCSYDATMRRLSQRLMEEYGEPAVARFWGGNENIRLAEEQRFLMDPLCQIMLATPNAGGKGRTWSVADQVIYFSSTNDLELRDQSEQRVQGVDKMRQVDYIDLIAPGTVESKILTALRKKINMASLITSSTWREWVV
jgi:SNF2 family DNA or RNA helicase